MEQSIAFSDNEKDILAPIKTNEEKEKNIQFIEDLKSISFVKTIDFFKDERSDNIFVAMASEGLEEEKSKEKLDKLVSLMDEILIKSNELCSQWNDINLSLNGIFEKSSEESEKLWESFSFHANYFIIETTQSEIHSLDTFEVNAIVFLAKQLHSTWKVLKEIRDFTNGFIRIAEGLVEKELNVVKVSSFQKTKGMLKSLQKIYDELIVSIKFTVPLIKDELPDLVASTFDYDNGEWDSSTESNKSLSNSKLYKPEEDIVDTIQEVSTVEEIQVGSEILNDEFEKTEKNFKDSSKCVSVTTPLLQDTNIIYTNCNDNIIFLNNSVNDHEIISIELEDEHVDEDFGFSDTIISELFSSCLPCLRQRNRRE